MVERLTVKQKIGQTMKKTTDIVIASVCIRSMLSKSKRASAEQLAKGIQRAMLARGVRCSSTSAERLQRLALNYLSDKGYLILWNNDDKFYIPKNKKELERGMMYVRRLDKTAKSLLKTVSDHKRNIKEFATKRGYDMDGGLGL